MAWRKASLLAGRIVLAAIFLFFGYLKVRPLSGLAWTVGSMKLSLLTSAMSVEAYEMLPHWAATALGDFLPIFEIVLGLWILSGLGLRFSSLVVAALLAVFVFAITWAYLHGLRIKCGCGDDDMVGPAKIAKDGLMLALAVGVMVGAWRERRAVGESR